MAESLKMPMPQLRKRRTGLPTSRFDKAFGSQYLSERDRVPRVQRERECRNRYLSERDRVNAEESERLFLFVINDRGIFGIRGKQKAKNYIPFDRVSIF